MAEPKRVIREDWNFPVTRQPSWDIQDATKVKSYLNCPRGYFYEYVLGWRQKGIAIHLHFGKAWHEGMEIMLLEGYRAGLEPAMKKFAEDFRKEVSEADDPLFAPKNMIHGIYGLNAYAERWVNDGASFKLEEMDGAKLSEIAGTGYTPNGWPFAFKMDGVIQHLRDRRVSALEHKTGGSTWRWAEQWALDPQVFIYHYALFMMYLKNKERVKGVLVNGVIFKRQAKRDVGKPPVFKEDQFIRVPCCYSFVQVVAYMLEVEEIIKRISDDFERLAGCSAEDPTMTCFPRNGKSCGNYGGCKYKDFCLAVVNPLGMDLPTGFMEEHWNPLDEHEGVANVVEIGG